MMSSDEIARERTLLKGTNDLTNGNLLTLPVGDGQILYVEPVYSQRSGQDSAFPKLLRVLVSYNGQVGYAPTIAEALSQVGINTSSTTDIREIDGSVVDPGKDKDKKKSKDEDKSNADGKDSSGNDDKDSNAKGAAGKTDKTDGKGTDTSPEQRVRDAMDKVNKTRESGSFEEFGKALDELDKAVQDLQSER